VLAVPGICFGYPQHLRLGFGGPTEELKEGLRRFAALLESTSVSSAAVFTHGSHG